jgi:hypothetical protein
MKRMLRCAQHDSMRAHQNADEVPHGPDYNAAGRPHEEVPHSFKNRNCALLRSPSADEDTSRYESSGRVAPARQAAQAKDRIDI